jgi:hypothetical protein
VVVHQCQSKVGTVLRAPDFHREGSAAKFASTISYAIKSYRPNTIRFFTCLFPHLRWCEGQTYHSPHLRWCEVLLLNPYSIAARPMGRALSSRESMICAIKCASLIAFESHPVSLLSRRRLFVPQQVGRSQDLGIGSGECRKDELTTCQGNGAWARRTWMLHNVRGSWIQRHTQTIMQVIEASIERYSLAT